MFGVQQTMSVSSVVFGWSHRIQCVDTGQEVPDPPCSNKRFSACKGKGSTAHSVPESNYGLGLGVGGLSAITKDMKGC